MFLANTYGIQNQGAIQGPGFSGAPFLGFLGGLTSGLIGQPGCSPCYGGGYAVPPNRANAFLGQYVNNDPCFSNYLNRTFNQSPFCGFPSYGAPSFHGGGRCVVLQPCSGNLSGYQNVCSNVFGQGNGPVFGSPFQGSGFGYAPHPGQSYGCGQVFGGHNCGRPQVIEVHHFIHHGPRPQRPACPPPQPPICPPQPPVCQPQPPVCLPQPPVCQEPPAPPQPPVCPEPPAPPVICQPQPPVCPPAPPAPPVQPQAVEAPKDPKKVVGFNAVDENWLGGERGWGRPSEMVASRLVGGSPEQQANIHFSGQNPDAPGPTRSERLTVWRTLQGDSRLRYDLDNKNFFLTNETGQHFPVFSLNDPLLTGLPNTHGNECQPVWTQIGARTNAVHNRIAGNNALPVAPEPVVVTPNPNSDLSSFFPNTNRLFG